MIPSELKNLKLSFYKTNLDYSRVATREKMPIDIDSFFSNKCLSGSTAKSGYLFDIAVIAVSIGIFYE
jgi:hypothetical protein